MLPARLPRAQLRRAKPRGASWGGAALTVCLLALAHAASVHAAVQILKGPTRIPEGDAKAAGDITVINEKLAFALAVESPVPYGVPRGALIDLAPVVNGQIGRDCVVFADFIPNNWSAWPNTYQHIKILEQSPQRAVIQAVRDWGKVTITTVYTLESNADSIEIRTTMKNGGDAVLADLLSGMTLWPRRGYLFAVPGLSGVVEGKSDGALAERVVSYDEDFSVALHAPYLDHIGDNSMDLYRQYSLAPGESRSFEASLQVGGRGDLNPVIRAEITRRHLDSGTVRGHIVGRDGKPIDEPVVVIEQQGKPYGWVVGRRGEYELQLPAGRFTLYATAKNYSQSDPVPIAVTAGSAMTQDFGGLQAPGSIQFSITDSRTHQPLDARISIADGQKPWVETLGRRTFFTALNSKGRIDLPIAPGRYVFTVSAGGGFVSRIESVQVSVTAGEAVKGNVAVTRLFDANSRQWYSADLHHHADQAEAVTPPEDLARSQMAAGLDVLFVSDHDSTVNHRVLQAIAERRSMAFMPAMEISASWGHFNAYPLKLGHPMKIDSGTATVDQIFQEGRRLGAVVIQVNHPFIPYGYLTSVRGGVAPGGFNPAFDLLEVNAAAPADDLKVLHTLWQFWNAGQRYYLAAGTDTHDVWNGQSGAERAFVHIDGAVTAQSFAQALKSGHAYVTAGPLVYPSVIFGDELKVKPGAAFSLGFDLQSVAGLKQAQLIQAGATIKTESFAALPQETRLEFPLTTEQSTWYSLIVEDAAGHKAYTNPIWVEAVKAPAGQP